VVRLVVTEWQLHSKIVNVTSLSPGQGTLSNEYLPKPGIMTWIAEMGTGLYTGMAIVSKTFCDN